MKEVYESYRKLLPEEAMIVTDTYLRGYQRAEHVELYNHMILNLEYYYYFVLPLEERVPLDLVRSASSLSI